MEKLTRTFWGFSRDFRCDAPNEEEVVMNWNRLLNRLPQQLPVTSEISRQLEWRSICIGANSGCNIFETNLACQFYLAKQTVRQRIVECSDNHNQESKVLRPFFNTHLLVEPRIENKNLVLDGFRKRIQCSKDLTKFECDRMIAYIIHSTKHCNLASDYRSCEVAISVAK